MLESSEVIFAVRDVVKSVAFYKDVLGFGNEWFWGEPPTFAGAGLGSVRVMFCEQPELAKHIEGHQHSFRSAEIDAHFEKHKAAGAQIISPIENKPWGIREYTVRDPDGYHLRFGGLPTHAKPPTALATMPTYIRIEIRKATAAEYHALHVGVGWDVPKDPEGNNRATAGVVAIDTRTNEAVGMARIMHEGWAWYSIWDVIVLPTYQSQRIGTALLESALSYLRANAPSGSLVYLFTYKQAFYEKLGFKSGSCSMIRI